MREVQNELKFKPFDVSYEDKLQEIVWRKFYELKAKGFFRITVFGFLRIDVSDKIHELLEKWFGQDPREQKES